MSPKTRVFTVVADLAQNIYSCVSNSVLSVKGLYSSYRASMRDVTPLSGVKSLTTRDFFRLLTLCFVSFVSCLFFFQSGLVIYPSGAGLWMASADLLVVSTVSFVVVGWQGLFDDLLAPYPSFPRCVYWVNELDDLFFYSWWGTVWPFVFQGFIVQLLVVLGLPFSVAHLFRAVVWAPYAEESFKSNGWLFSALIAIWEYGPFLQVGAYAFGLFKLLHLGSNFVPARHAYAFHLAWNVGCTITAYFMAPGSPMADLPGVFSVGGVHLYLSHLVEELLPMFAHLACSLVVCWLTVRSTVETSSQEWWRVVVFAPFLEELLKSYSVVWIFFIPCCEFLFNGSRKDRFFLASRALHLWSLFLPLPICWAMHACFNYCVMLLDERRLALSTQMPPFDARAVATVALDVIRLRSMINALLASKGPLDLVGAASNLVAFCGGGALSEWWTPKYVELATKFFVDLAAAQLKLSELDCSTARSTAKARYNPFNMKASDLIAPSMLTLFALALRTYTTRTTSACGAFLTDLTRRFLALLVLPFCPEREDPNAKGILNTIIGALSPPCYDDLPSYVDGCIAMFRQAICGLAFALRGDPAILEESLGPYETLLFKINLELNETLAHDPNYDKLGSLGRLEEYHSALKLPQYVDRIGNAAVTAQVLTKLASLRSDVAAAELRPVPVALHFCSSAGWGKSSMLADLAVQVCKFLNVPANHNTIGNWFFDRNFHDTITAATRIYLMDDIWNVNFSKDHEQPVSELLRVISGGPAPIEKAGVEEKGKVYGRPLAVFSAANRNFREDIYASLFNSVRDAEPFNRRFLDVECCLAPGSYSEVVAADGAVKKTIEYQEFAGHMRFDVREWDILAKRWDLVGKQLTYFELAQDIVRRIRANQVACEAQKGKARGGLSVPGYCEVCLELTAECACSERVSPADPRPRPANAPLPPLMTAPFGARVGGLVDSARQRVADFVAPRTIAQAPLTPTIPSPIRATPIEGLGEGLVEIALTLGDASEHSVKSYLLAHCVATVLALSGVVPYFLTLASAALVLACLVDARYDSGNLRRLVAHLLESRCQEQLALWDPSRTVVLHLRRLQASPLGLYQTRLRVLWREYRAWCRWQDLARVATLERVAAFLGTLALAYVAWRWSGDAPALPSAEASSSDEATDSDSTLVPRSRMLGSLRKYNADPAVQDLYGANVPRALRNTQKAPVFPDDAVGVNSKDLIAALKRSMWRVSVTPRGECPENCSSSVAIQVNNSCAITVAHAFDGIDQAEWVAEYDPKGDGVQERPSGQFDRAYPYVNAHLNEEADLMVLHTSSYAGNVPKCIAQCIADEVVTVPTFDAMIIGLDLENRFYADKVVARTVRTLCIKGVETSVNYGGSTGYRYHHPLAYYVQKKGYGSGYCGAGLYIIYDNTHMLFVGIMAAATPGDEAHIFVPVTRSMIKYTPILGVRADLADKNLVDIVGPLSASCKWRAERDIMRYLLPHGGPIPGRIVASLKQPLGRGDKPRMRQTPFHEKVVERLSIVERYAPAQAHVVRSELNPHKLGYIEHYMLGLAGKRDRLRPLGVNTYWRMVEKHLAEVVRNEALPLTMADAINGVPGSARIGSIDMSTSGGYGYPGAKRRYNDSATTERHPDGKAPTPELREAVEKIVASWRLGNSETPIVTAGPKLNEVREEKKILAGKSRAIFCYSLPFLIACRMYVQPIVEVMHSMFGLTESAVGINCFSAEWMEAYLYLKTIPQSKSLKLDFSKYDASQTSTTRDTVDSTFYKVAECGTAYTPVDLLALRTCLHDMAYCFVVINNDVYVLIGSNMSGGPTCTEVNTNSTKLIYVCVLSELIEPERLLSEWQTHIRLLLYGDDSVFSASPEIMRLLPFGELARVFAENGFVITGSGASDIAEWEDHSQGEFLKRSFDVRSLVMEEDGVEQTVRVVFAPLVLPSICKSLLWYCPTMALPQKEHLRLLLENAVKEAWQHGPKIYGEISDLARDCLIDIGLEPRVPSSRELTKMYYGGKFVTWGS